jgi:23S rRNA (adenine2030-N6)-methyltransferase
MNYRHAFHAGNFADVLKHVVLALCLEYLKTKPAPFRVLDTHAGSGLYELGSGLAEKTGEWRDGVGRLLDPSAPEPPADIIALLHPWLTVLLEADDAPVLTRYPGSPIIARHLMREQDHLVLTELHPSERNSLATRFRGDDAVKVLELDGWMALKSCLPFNERRGLVLIDPPYEDRDELVKLPARLGEALRRFANGVYVVWYPIKEPAAIASFHAELAALGPLKMLRADLLVRPISDQPGLHGCGLLVINPPWTLPAQLDRLMPFLATRLAQASGGSYVVTSSGID